MTAQAAPPFSSDGPEPTEYRHVEIYAFTTMDRAEGTTVLQVPALEIDWGFAHDWQFHFQLPGVLNMPNEGSNAYGPSDVELGVVYRFIHETEMLPQVGFTPLWNVPSGDQDRGLGNGQGWIRLPIWLQKSWGPWTVYGGGGYAINSAPQARNYGYGGLVIQRKLNEKWTLGAELARQDAAVIGSNPATMLTLGGYYNINDHISLLFSAGHSIVGEGHVQGYVGIYWDLPV